MARISQATPANHRESRDFFGKAALSTAPARAYLGQDSERICYVHPDLCTA